MVLTTFQHTPLPIFIQRIRYTSPVIHSLMSGNKRKFCFLKGKFFVLLDPGLKSGNRIAIGPDFYVTIPFSIALICSGYLMKYLFTRVFSTSLAYVMLISYILTLISYFYTSLLDPGIIKANEDNSIENRNTLEPLGYTYCSLCGLYRPPKAYHCDFCGRCFYNHDHHCTFMGQCVAKNNTVSFYIFILSILIYLISLEVSTMTVFSSKGLSVNRQFGIVGDLTSLLTSTHHLRSAHPFHVSSIHKHYCSFPKLLKP